MKPRIWAGLLAGALALGTAGSASAQIGPWRQPPMSYSSLSYYTGALTPWGYFPGSIPRLQIIPEYYGPYGYSYASFTPGYGWAGYGSPFQGWPGYGAWTSPWSPPRW